MISTAEAAKILGKSVPLVKILAAKDARLGAVKVGTTWVFDEATVRKFAKIKRPGPGNPNWRKAK